MNQYDENKSSWRYLGRQRRFRGLIPYIDYIVSLGLDRKLRVETSLNQIIIYVVSDDMQRRHPHAVTLQVRELGISIGGFDSTIGVAVDNTYINAEEGMKFFRESIEYLIQVEMPGGG